MGTLQVRGPAWGPRESGMQGAVETPGSSLRADDKHLVTVSSPGSTAVFCTGPDSKYPGLGQPDCPAAQPAGVHVNKWASMGSSKTLFTKISGLALGSLPAIEILTILCGDKWETSDGLKCWVVVSKEMC